MKLKLYFIIFFASLNIGYCWGMENIGFDSANLLPPEPNNLLDKLSQFYHSDNPNSKEDSSTHPELVHIRLFVLIWKIYKFSKNNTSTSAMLSMPNPAILNDKISYVRTRITRNIRVIYCLKNFLARRQGLLF